jgi:hypothetical protein
MSDQRIHEIYRSYDLIVAFRDDKWLGRVAKNKKVLADIEGDSKEAVHESLKEIVDSIIAEKLGNRGDASPAAQEYIDAFNAIMSKIHDGQFAMLKAHYHATDRTMTATQLAEAAGYAGYESANLQYGKLGDKLNAELNMDLPKNMNGTRIATFVLADGQRIAADEREWHWTMRPEVAEAVEYLGLNN